MVSEVAKAINDNGIAIWDSFDIEVTVWVDSYMLEFVVLINSKTFVLDKFSNYVEIYSWFGKEWIACVIII